MKIIKLIKSNYKAGLTVAMINIPLSISLRVASGATPTQGIITGIWATIIASIFASSNYNIFGVAGALTSIILGFVLSHQNGVSLLPFLAIITGIIITIIYLLKIIKYITLIPVTVLHGFLISVGIIIALTQLMPAFGLNNPALGIENHKEIYLNIYEIIKNFGSINIFSFIIFILGVSFLLVIKKFFPKIPGVILITIIGIFIGYLSQKGIIGFEILVLSEKFPELGFSIFQNPFINLDKITNNQIFLDMIKISIFIAIIAILETIISAKIREKITKEKFKKNKEVLGLGLANIGTGIMGGIPVSRVFVRTALNIDAKANHKMSQFLTGFFTFLIALLLFNDFFKYIPFPIIRAILFTIAIGLIDIKLLKNTYDLDKTAFFVMIITTFVAIIEDATYGILVGTFIALIIFIKRISSGDIDISLFKNGNFIKKISLKKCLNKKYDFDTGVIKFRGSINFLNIETLIENISIIEKGKRIIFSFSSVGDIDLDGIEGLEEICHILDKNSIKYYFTGINKEIENFLEKKDFYKKLKNDGKIFSSTSMILNNK